MVWISQMLHFVLVEPAVPENVGAAARALKTMGFSSLWIVNSQIHRDKQAHIVAHASQDILETVREFQDLAQVRDQVDLMVGTSAKPRHHREVLLTPEVLRENLLQKQDAVQQVALVFGREESGLHGHEIALCDVLTSIPLASAYPSLNLGQSVMLYAYVLNQLTLSAAEVEYAPDQYVALREKCDHLLTAVGYASDEKLYHWLMERLPLLDKRSIGFAHHLVDKLRGLLQQTRK